MSDKTKPCTLYRPEDIENARANVERYAWAQQIVEGWRTDVEYAMHRDREFFDAIIPDLTPWSSYAHTCPVCVGKESGANEDGIWLWEITAPEQVACKYCGTVYPNSDYPETGRLVCSSMGQTFTYYETEEERAHPADRSGRYAYHWGGWPVHPSWSGLVRYFKAEWATRKILPLAKLYAVADEVGCAERAVWIMDRFARVFPHYLYHSYDGTFADCPPGEAAVEMGRHPRAGRFPKEVIVNASGQHQHEDHAALNNGFWGAGRFSPHGRGSDAGPLLDITVAYDLIRGARYQEGKPVLDPNVEERIVNDLILPGCADMENWKDINNKCAPGLSLSAAAGILFNRPGSVRRALEGLRMLLEECYHFDGLCKESPSYSAHHLGNIWELPEILRGYSDPEGFQSADGQRLDDLDPFGESRYRLALESMARMLTPGRAFPPIGDTFVGSGISSIYAEMLTDRYDSQYGALLEMVQGGPVAERGSEYALWYRDPDLNPDGEKPLPLESEWYPGWHVAALRAGKSDGETAFYFNGNGSGVHRHRDTLSISYYSGGRELASDRGYMGSCPENRWFVSSGSHNLVLVDGEDQIAGDRRSTLELFGASPDVEVVQASSNAYSQCSQYRRTCVLVRISDDQTYAVDLFRVTGGRFHQYCFNCNGEMVGLTAPSLDPVDGEIEWLTNLRAARPEGPFTATWRCGGTKMDLVMLSEVDRLMVADAPGWRRYTGNYWETPPIQQILAERQGDDGLTSQFAALMVPYGSGRSPVMAARLVENNLESGTMSVAVELVDRTDYVISSLDHETRECGPITISGRLGFASISASADVTQAYLLDGTSLACGETKLTLRHPALTLKVACVSGRTFYLEETVSADAAIPGSYLLAGDTAFEIESVAGARISVRNYPAIPCNEVTVLNSALLKSSPESAE